jgi:hypothetical protein
MDDVDIEHGFLQVQRTIEFVCKLIKALKKLANCQTRPPTTDASGVGVYGTNSKGAVV